MRDVEKLLKDCKVVLLSATSTAYMYVDRLVYVCLQCYLPCKDYDFYPIFRVNLPPITYGVGSSLVTLKQINAGLVFTKYAFPFAKNSVDIRFYVNVDGRIVFERNYHYECSKLCVTYTSPLTLETLPGYVVILALRDELVERMFNVVTDTLKKVCGEVAYG